MVGGPEIYWGAAKATISDLNGMKVPGQEGLHFAYDIQVSGPCT